MRDLFQTVYELKKQEIEMTRQQQIMKGSGLYLEALASTTSKIDHVCLFNYTTTVKCPTYFIIYFLIILYKCFIGQL